MRRTVVRYARSLVTTLICCLAATAASGEIRQTVHPNGKVRDESPYVDGRLHGTYKQYYESGALHETIPYVAGREQGIARRYYENGQVAEETPKDRGSIEGLMRRFYENGRVREELPHVAGAIHGTYKSFYESGARHEEIPYTHGYEDGVARRYFENGRLAEETPKSRGKIEGLMRRFDDSGQLREELPHVAGAIHGNYKAFYDSGALYDDTPYTHGYEDGVARRYFEDGRLAEETPKSRGRIEGLMRRFHANGQLREELPHVSGAIHGVYKTYYESGALHERSDYVNGLLSGTLRRYHEDGQLSEQIEYVNGVQGSVQRFEHDSAEALAARIPVPAPQLGPMAPASARSVPAATAVAAAPTEIVGPDGRSMAVATTIDPGTGIATTVLTANDGTQVSVRSEVIEHPDGTTRVIEVDEQGNLLETIVADGATYTQSLDNLGTAMGIASAPSGAFVAAEVAQDGTTIRTVRDESGELTTTVSDLSGNVLEAMSLAANGNETRASIDGTVVERTLAPDGSSTETTTDRRGNTTTVELDAAGEVVARTDVTIGPKEPGQQYYETVMNGADWHDLSLEQRFGFASKERRVRLDADLAAIDAEQQAADSRAAERIAREQREVDIERSYVRAEELQRDYDAAVASGNFSEIRRIKREQDAHMQASNDLLALSADEQAAMDRKQQLRDEIYARVVTSARAQADRIASEDWGQDLKESVTSATSVVSQGSQMQQETRQSTRLANYEIAFSNAKREGFQRELDNPSTTPEMRAIIQDMLTLADVQEAGAQEQLAANSRLTAAGYAIDVGLLATGGVGNVVGSLGTRALVRTVGREATERIVDIAARRGITELAQTGALAATERVAGTQAAERLAATATRAADAGSAALTRIAQAGNNAATRIVGEAGVQRVSSAVSTTANTLGREVTRRGLGQQAESRLLAAMAQETAVGGVADAGLQLWMTGSIDTGQLVRNAVGGGIAGGGVSRAIDALPIGGGRGTPDGAPPAAQVGPPNVRPPEVPVVANAAPPARAAAPSAAPPAPPQNSTASPRNAARPAAAAPAPRVIDPAFRDAPTVVDAAGAPTVNTRGPTLIDRVDDVGTVNTRAPTRIERVDDVPTVNTQAPTRIERVDNAATVNTRAPTRIERVDNAPTVNTQAPTLSDGRTAAGDTPRTAAGNVSDTLVVAEPAPRPAARRLPPRPRAEPNASADGFLRDERAWLADNVLNRDPAVGAQSLAQLQRLDEVERSFAGLNSADQARLRETWETWQRLRSRNPLFASVDDLDAFAGFTRTAGEPRPGGGGFSRYAPEEIVANLAARRNVPIGADELARAANVSLPNAEGAIRGAAPSALDVPTPGARRPVELAAPPGTDPATQTAAREAAMEALRRRTDELFDFNRPLDDVPVDPALEGLRRGTDEAFDLNRPVELEPVPAAPRVDAASTRAPELVDFEEGALTGHRTSITRPDGSQLDLVIGDYVNQGATNQVYRLASAPGKVVRITRQSGATTRANFDLAGRRALQDIAPSLGPDLEFVGAEIFANVQSTTPELNGRTVMVMDEVNLRGLEQLRANPNGMPTNGQAIAWSRGLRALNGKGYAALDGHPANFFFRKVAEPDEWVLVITDAGGIVPAAGASDAERALNARAIQRLVDDPPNRPPQDPDARKPINFAGKAVAMSDELADRVDFRTLRRLGIDGIDDLLDPDILFKPSGAEDYPLVRRLFSTPDEEVEAAYQALRVASAQ
jgi:antitoxin component YwqK of YwqJK toxin-antitoxin module